MMKKLSVAVLMLFVATVVLRAQSVGILTYSGGIWSPAVSTSTSNPVGNVSSQVRVYCYNTILGQWVPGDSSCFGAGGGGGISPTTYGAKGDGQFISDATLVSGQNTISCAVADGGADDCNFTAADNGKICFASNATTDVSQINTAIVLPEGTLTVVDAQHATCSGGNSTQSIAHDASFIWGHLDTAAYNATQNASTDPVYAAWQQAATQCKPLSIPAGIFLVERGEANNSISTSGCANVNRTVNIRSGYAVNGTGPATTILIITPNFPATDCTGPNGLGVGCLFSAPNLLISDLQVWGAGNSDPGASFAGKIAVNLTGQPLGENAFLHRVIFDGWGAARHTFTGISAIRTDLSELWIDGNSIIEAFGSPTIDTAGDISSYFVGGAICCNLGLDPVFNIRSGAKVYTNGVGIGNFSNVEPAPQASVTGGGQWFSTSDYTYTPGGQIAYVQGAGSTVSFVNDKLETLTGVVGLFVDANGTATVGDGTVLSSLTPNLAVVVQKGGTLKQSAQATVSGVTNLGTAYFGTAVNSFGTGQYQQCNGSTCTNDNWVAAPITTHTPASGAVACGSATVTVGGCAGGTKYYSLNGAAATAYTVPVTLADSGLGQSVLASRCEIAHDNPSFPTNVIYPCNNTTITDNFGGAASTDLHTYNAAWVYNSGTAHLNGLGGVVSTGGAYSAAHRSDGPNTAVQYAQAGVSPLGSGVIVHASAGANTFYLCAASSTVVGLYYVNAGGFSVVHQDTYAAQAGDTLYLDGDTTGHTQNCKVVRAGLVIHTINGTDTNIASPGFAGIYVDATGSSGDYIFQAGEGTNF